MEEEEEEGFVRTRETAQRRERICERDLRSGGRSSSSSSSSFLLSGLVLFVSLWSCGEKWVFFLLFCILCRVCRGVVLLLFGGKDIVVFSLNIFQVF